MGGRGTPLGRVFGVSTKSTARGAGPVRCAGDGPYLRDGFCWGRGQGVLLLTRWLEGSVGVASLACSAVAVAESSVESGDSAESAASRASGGEPSSGEFLAPSLRCRVRTL